MVGMLSWLVPRWAQACERRIPALPGGSPSEVPSYHLPHRQSGLCFCTSSGSECDRSHTKLELAAASQISQVPECGNHGTLASGKQIPWPRSTVGGIMITRALTE